MTWVYHWATGGYSAQPRYYRFPYEGCEVGCGPVAWAILFCWADIQAEKSTKWAGRKGIFRMNGGKGAFAVAPLYMDPEVGVRKVIKEIHGYVGTFCILGSGATYPWNMFDAHKYLSGRSGLGVSTDYNSVGISTDSLRSKAAQAIKYRQTPAIIGTGWLSHYPVAYGYATQKRIIRYCFFYCWDEVVYDRSFRVNQGSGSSSGEWVPAETWYYGSIFP